VQPDGKVVVAGETQQNMSTKTTFIARYDSDGTLDLPFGGGDGVVEHSIGTLTWSSAWDVKVQPDGRIVTGGYFAVPGDNNVFAARYEADGSIDSGFGVDGAAMSDMASSGSSEGWSLALGPKGSIFVGGYVDLLDNGAWEIAALKLDEVGHPDSDFGGDGVVTMDHGAGEGVLFGIDVDPDGNVVGGGITEVAGKAKLLATRWEPDGTPDPLFAGTGSVIMGPTAGDAQFYDVMTLPDGDVLLAGFDNDPADRDVVVGRLQHDGTPDLSWGPDGIIRHDVGAADSARAATLVDGHVVVAGYAGLAPNRPLVIRYDALQIPDFQNGVTDWNDGDGMFGTCLAGVGGDAVATWSPGTCAASDAGTWRGIDPVPDEIAATSVPAQSGTVSLRFGLRVPSATSPGPMYAPLTFEVVPL
jgi:uncharacterized delta-60 repeat protein